MSSPNLDDLGNMSMLDLYRVETENQAAVLTSALLALERHPGTNQAWQVLMRAAHSLKGAARIVGLDPVVGLAHAMEDLLSAAQHGKLRRLLPGRQRCVNLSFQFEVLIPPMPSLGGWP